MFDKLVSIIIPVYNNQEFLSKCLDSIIDQTYKNIEVVLVDDGSTDNSVCILDEYQNRDSRFRVYHRENQGPSLERYFGLSVIHGEYVQFFDSDDWMKPTMIEKLVQSAEANNSDIVWCDVELVERTGNHIFKLKYEDQRCNMLKHLYSGEIPGWLSNKLIRRSILSDIIFPKAWMMEDVFISSQLLLKQEKNSYVNEALYCYNRLNEHAATTQFSGDNVLLKAITNIDNCYKFLVEHNVFDQYKQHFAVLAMRLKLAIYKTQGFKEAKKVYPFAHTYVHAFGLPAPVCHFYWLGFNCGKFGELLFELYMSRHKLKTN